MSDVSRVCQLDRQPSSEKLAKQIVADDIANGLIREDQKDAYFHAILVWLRQDKIKRIAKFPRMN